MSGFVSVDPLVSGQPSVNGNHVRRSTKQVREMFQIMTSAAVAAADVMIWNI